MKNYKSYNEFIAVVHSTKNIAEVQFALNKVIDEMTEKDSLKNKTVELLEKIESNVYKETDGKLSTHGMMNVQHTSKLISDYKKILM